jgi:hypothetical protein
VQLTSSGKTGSFSVEDQREKSNCNPGPPGPGDLGLTRIFCAVLEEEIKTGLQNLVNNMCALEETVTVLHPASDLLMAFLIRVGAQSRWAYLWNRNRPLQEIEFHIARELVQVRRLRMEDEA